ncbi:cytochrome P450 [Mariannaea sp. PMI_226]|nr:cytochrome P450 [Mariannaea sp. PMI_226]
MDMDMGDLRLWSSASLVSALIYLSGLTVYRIFFHPLSKYPGPLLAKVTDAYLFYFAWRGDRHLEFWRLHEKYGSIVRFGPNSLSFNSAKGLKDIYGVRSNLRKAEFYDAFQHPAPNTHNTRDKVLHARNRRVLGHAFADGPLRMMERYMLANIRTFCDLLAQGDQIPDRKGWSFPKDMARWCDYLTLDVLGELCFGKSFHLLEQDDDRWVIEMTSIAAKRDLLCGSMPLIPKLGLDKILFRQANADCVKYNDYSQKQLTDRTRLGSDTDRRDFFYYLLNARDPETGEGFTTDELWGEANLLIIAGSDTTSTAMAAALFYLVRSPTALQRATTEVRDQFEATGVESITPSAHLSGCGYLRACIDEAMRLSPSVTGLLPRETLEGGAIIDGEDIPSGTVVGTPLYALHRNEAHFSSPHSYLPERWIAGAKLGGDDAPEVTSTDVAHSQKAFAPFSIGPRGCIAKNMAYMEMMTTLARVLFLFDLRKAVGVQDPGEGGEGGWGRHRVGDYQLVDTFTSGKNGPIVEFRRRI